MQGNASRSDAHRRLLRGSELNEGARKKKGFGAERPGPEDADMVGRMGMMDD